MKNKSVLITGAIGMIGSYMIDFLRYLNKKHDTSIHIYAMSRNKNDMIQRFGDGTEYLQFIEQDLITPFIMSSHFDYIIHAGGINSPYSFEHNPVETIKTTLIGTMSLLDMARRNDSQFTFISTGEIYGHDCEHIFDECDPGCIDTKNSRACYPESRRAAETLCVSYGKQYGVKFNVARLGYVFGPTISKNSDLAVAQFLRTVANGQDIILKSTGKQLRTWLYVADAVSGILHIVLNKKRGEFYNVAGTVSSLKDFAETLAQVAGVNVKCENVAGSDVANSLLSAKKLHDIGWHPSFNLQDAINRTYNIYKKQITK